MVSVPTQRARPVRENTFRQEIVQEQGAAQEPETAQEPGTAQEPKTVRQQGIIKTTVRPRRGAKIRFRLKENEGELEGRVSRVGKASGKDQHRCWIRGEDESERSYDFSTEVEEWNNINMVHFTEDVPEKETAKEIQEKDKQMDQKGTQVLFYAMREDLLEDERKVQEVLVTEVPKKYHNSPEVITAKEAEMANFIRFEAFEEVEDVGQPRISSRWVVTEKQEHDGMKVKIKSRLVVRGFQEAEHPRSDSPTLSKESLKMMMSIAANEGWKIQSLDVKNAYLQGKKINREVFVQPPADYAKPGKLWKLLKNVYGTYDGARSFFLSMDESLKELKCQQVTGDDALYIFHYKGKLAGILGLHVDDIFLLDGDTFEENVVKPLKKKYVFGKEETQAFRFTGVDVTLTERGIEINQAKYCESIQEIPVPDKKNTERELTLEEYKMFRGAIGKLNWLQESTRPDLSFDNLNMSMKNKNATVHY